jgi:hypothetical protein
MRLSMKAQMVEQRKLLLQLKVGETVKAKFNGVIWDAQIHTIREFTHSLPDFRLRFPDDKALYWVSGVQIILT